MEKMNIQRFVVNAMQTNCYLLYREDGGEAIIIDPGSRELRNVLQHVSEHGLKVTTCLLTHGHYDHICGIEKVRELGAEVYADEHEVELMENEEMNVSLKFHRPYTASPDKTFTDGDILSFAGIDLEVIETPGHTEGCVCFYLREENVLFTGDTLFRLSVGRTDFLKGDPIAQKASLQKIFALPSDTLCLTGHNEETTIGFEKENNPFA